MGKTARYSTAFYKKTVFRSILFLSAVLVICLILCIVSVYRRGVQNVKDTAHAETQISMNHLNTVIDNASRICLFFSDYQEFSPVFQTYTELNLRKATMQSELSTFVACFDFIESIHVDTGEYTVTAGSETNERDYVLLCDYNTFNVQYAPDNQWPFLLSVSSIQESVASFKTNLLISCKTVGRNYFGKDTICISENGDILISSDTDLLGQNVENIYGIESADLISKTLVGRYVINADRVSDGSAWIVTIIDSFAPENNTFMQTAFLIIACVLILILGIVFVLYSFGNVYRPIDKMVQMFKYFLPTNQIQVEDDIRFISQCVNDKKYDEDTRRAVIQLKKSQLYTLHAQISPHFLANSLEILKWESIHKLGLGNTIEESLDILSGFLVETQSYRKMFCTIEEEIERTKQYEILAGYCFHKNLKVNWNVHEDTLQSSIVSLTLQPLLENSIIHGFSQMADDEEAIIDISIFPENENIRLIVQDNGRGMSESTLDEIRSATTNEDPCEHYIGIKNTHLKLRMLYGEKYGITDIRSGPDGTVFELLIPAYTYPPTAP